MASREKEQQHPNEWSRGWLTLVMVWALVCSIAAYRSLIRMELEPPRPKPFWDVQADRLEVSRVCLVPGDAARCETRVRVPANREHWRVTVIDEQGRPVRTLGTMAGGEEVRWDGRDGRGKSLAPGLYAVVARQPDAPVSPPLMQRVRADPTPPRILITGAQVSGSYSGMNGHNHWISIKGNLIDPPPVVPWGATPLLAVQWRPSGEPGWQSEKRAVAWVHAKDPPEVRGDLEIPVQRVRGPEIEVRVITADTTQDVIASSPYHIWLPQEED